MNNSSTKSIAVLMTCFNRKEKTLGALNALLNNYLPQGYAMEVYLVDDGSSDGTSQAIIEQFPSVILIKGNGQLYWNGGMICAWEKAYSLKSHDFYLWLNDDTILCKTAISCMIGDSEMEYHHSIICGTTVSPHDSGKITYGGYINGHKIIIPQGMRVLCNYFNGNCVLIPESVFNSIGYLDRRFRHALGDFDYGLRAGKAGVKSVVASQIVGICEEHNDLPGWCNRKTPLKKRLKLLYSPLGNHPFEAFVYEKRHHGILIAVFHLLTNHMRAFFPNIWSKYKKGEHH